MQPHKNMSINPKNQAPVNGKIQPKMLDLTTITDGNEIIDKVDTSSCIHKEWYITKSWRKDFSIITNVVYYLCLEV